MCKIFKSVIRKRRKDLPTTIMLILCARACCKNCFDDKNHCQFWRKHFSVVVSVHNWWHCQLPCKIYSSCSKKNTSHNILNTEVILKIEVRFLMSWKEKWLKRQIAKVVSCMLLERQVWGSNPEPIKSSTSYQGLATAETLKCGPWRKATEMEAAHSWHLKWIKRV